MQVITTLMGANFRPATAKAMLREAVIGERLSLEPDAENEYDPSAVRVIRNGEHVGFVARGDNGPIFARLTAGDELFAEIIAFESVLKPVLEINL